MHELDRFHIDIYKLSNSTHEYDFEFNDVFFDAIEESIVEKGSGKIDIVLTKNDSFIKLTMKINGQVELTCDRSLETFDFPLEVNSDIIFKYGDEEVELDDEVYMITRETQRINIAQIAYEFIGLQIPMKKLHPKYDNSSEEDELVYFDDEKENEENSSAFDPRWEALKKLK